MKNVIINGKVILENSIKELNVFFEDGLMCILMDVMVVIQCMLLSRI